MKRPLLAVPIIILALGCIGAADVPLEQAATAQPETVRFEGAITLLAAGRGPDPGAPCGGITLGSADNTVHEWTVPNGTARVHLHLEVGSNPTMAALRLCLLRADGEEIVERGVPPIELMHEVEEGEEVLVVVRADDTTGRPYGPTTFSVTATALPSPAG